MLLDTSVAMPKCSGGWGLARRQPSRPRGQALSEANLHTIGHVIAGRTGLPVQNIQLIVWAK